MDAAPHPLIGICTILYIHVFPKNMKYSQFHDMRDSEKELWTSILLSFLARDPV